ncbi:delta and Notch-like epidermal growth factor-related receptor isoform X2 [Protopterus annectens]|uniref:delta and Notch-like epidermal growth factor-related receptor isoform X2 n=1 Tax=Protopterus annectens TaxID=7888 RepID=UPI001CFB39A0|nr:delta and Notch-like epidermal growth factor-related receptor isoform X2 [Protopterus annectens]
MMLSLYFLVLVSSLFWTGILPLQFNGTNVCKTFIDSNVIVEEEYVEKTVDDGDPNKELLETKKKRNITHLIQLIDYVCCPGWSEDGDECPIPVCDKACQNGGFCIGPNTCNCTSGYTGAQCQTELAAFRGKFSEEDKPDYDPIEEERHRKCNKPGYVWSNHCCSSTCPTKCLNGGWCSFGNVCQCLPYYYGTFCEKYRCSPPCENGECVGPGMCACYTGWTGRTCADDINECAFNNGGCEQSCTNQRGSYSCICTVGYTYSRSNWKKCSGRDTVSDEINNHMTGAVIGIIIGICFLFIVLAVLIGCYIRKRRMATEPTPDDYPVKEKAKDNIYEEVFVVSNIFVTHEKDVADLKEKA